MSLDPQLWTAFGCGLAIFLSAMGSAKASATGGIFAMRGPNLKAFVPIVMAGVLAIYGLIIGCFLSLKMGDATMTPVQGYKNFAAGLVVGSACLASAWGMSLFVGSMNDGKCAPAVSAPSMEMAADADETTPLVNTLRGGGGEGVYAKASFIKAILSLIYIEAIGLYGLVIALILTHEPK